MHQNEDEFEPSTQTPHVDLSADRISLVSISLPNPCYVVFADHLPVDDLHDAVETFTDKLKAAPKLVIHLSNGMQNKSQLRLVTAPWVTVVKTNQIQIACPGSGGTGGSVTFGLWDHPLLGTSLPTARCGRYLPKELRITYNNWDKFKIGPDAVNWFNRSTYEGFILGTFVDKYGVEPVFLNASWQWGSLDKATNTWNGLVGNVCYDRSDLAVALTLTPTYGRNKAVDFTHYIQEVALQWISRKPDPLPKWKNLTIALNGIVWATLIVAIFIFALALAIAARVGKPFGIVQPDISSLLLAPVAMLNQEEMPTWFFASGRTSRKNRLNEPRERGGYGSGGNLLLITWALMGMVLMIAFTCNLRSLMLKTEYAKPLDTTEQLANSDKRVMMSKTAFFKAYLEASDNPNIIKILTSMVTYYPDQNIAKVLDSVAFNSDMVTMDYAVKLKGNKPWHTSKERLRSSFAAFAVQKHSIWIDVINMHLLTLHQSGISQKAFNDLLGRRPTETEENVEPLQLNHLIGQFGILVIGLAISTLAFGAEILISFKQKQGKNQYNDG